MTGPAQLRLSLCSDCPYSSIFMCPSPPCTAWLHFTEAFYHYLFILVVARQNWGPVVLTLQKTMSSKQPCMDKVGKKVMERYMACSQHWLHNNMLWCPLCAPVPGAFCISCLSSSYWTHGHLTSLGAEPAIVGI